MTENLSASDVALMTERRDGDYGFGGGGIWLIVIILMFMMGGNWGNNGRGNAVTEADLCNANSFNELKQAVGRLNDQVNGVNQNLSNAICSLGYESLKNFNELERQMGNQHCEQMRALDGAIYNCSQQAAETRAVVVAQTQKVLDQLCADRAAQMQARINQLELNQALFGVVRYPNGFVYNAGNNPFCNNGCGC